MSARGEETPRRYDLLERIAVGGMAEIFRAKAHGAHGFEKTLAIKRILPDLARDAEFEHRFIAEAKLAVTLTHANVVQIFDFGRFAGSLYIAMEYVDGLDLGRFLKGADTHGGVPLGAAMHVAMEMCKGLDVAHARRVVHSDISPSNVLLSRLGEVKIADFGIARAAAEEGAGPGAGEKRVMGKWPYMSPEQTRGEPLDARSDVFSAAVVMYELFTGEKLFRGRDAGEIVQSVRTMEIPPPSSRRPSLPPALDEVLGKALARDPARRHQHASELLRALVDVSYTHTVVATAMDVADAIARWFPPAAEGDVDGVDADALIREGLGLAAEASGPRRTERGSTPARATAVASAPSFDSDRDSGVTGRTLAEAPRQKVTFVRGEQGPDGIPLWELTIAGDPAVAPAPVPPARQRRWPLVAGAMAALALAAGLYVSRNGGARIDDSARAVVSIESTPPGARVVWDGRELAAPTPTMVEVREPRADQRHDFTLRLAGYRVWEKKDVALDRGARVFFRAQLEAPATKLVVATDPPGAEVAVDGRTIGRTPLGNVTLTADGLPHALRLRRHGYVDVTDQIELVDGRDVVVDRKLSAVQRMGTIDLHVDPWAYVYLDGRKIGEAPVKGLPLPVGHHVLKLVNPARHKQKLLAVDVPSHHAYRVKLP